jgi:hypothetical protein
VEPSAASAATTAVTNLVSADISVSSVRRSWCCHKVHRMLRVPPWNAPDRSPNPRNLSPFEARIRAQSLQRRRGGEANSSAPPHAAWASGACRPRSAPTAAKQYRSVSRNRPRRRRERCHRDGVAGSAQGFLRGRADHRAGGAAEIIPTTAPAVRQLGREWDCCFCIEPPALRPRTFSHNNPAAFSVSSRMPSIFGVTPYW